MLLNNCKKLSLVVITLLTSFSGIAQDFTIKNFTFPENTYSFDIFSVGDTVWVTNSTGAAMFDGNSWEYFNKDNGLTSDSCDYVVQDSQGTVWFARKWGGLTQLQDGKWNYFLYPQYDYSDIHLLERVGENIWFQHWFNDLLNISDTDTISYKNIILNGIEQDSNLDYWAFNTFGNIYHLDDQIWKSDTILNYIVDLHIDRNDNKWVLRQESAIFLREDTAALFHEINCPFFSKPIPHFFFTKITSDRFGNIYIGTRDKGLVIKSNNMWYHLDSWDGLLSDRVNDIEIDQNDNVWISGGNGVSVLLNDGWIGDTNKLEGVIYSDINNNGQQDVGESGLPNQFVKIESSGGYVISDTEGNFSFRPVEGENTIAILLKDFWEQGSTPLSYTFTYPNTSLPSFEIGLKWKVVKDIAVSLSGNTLRPGFDSWFYLSAKNEGSATSSTTLALNYDSKLNFISSDIAPSVNHAGHLEWALVDLQSLQSKSIQLLFNLPESVPIGTLIKNAVTTTTLEGETDLTDNLDSLKTIVTGSWDPNDKLVAEGILEERFVEIGSKLTYTIRFQNTGTDTAFVVRIKDEIDPNLEITSLEILASSHPINYSLEEKILRFRFPGIKLVDSVHNEPASHGYVKYRIGALSSIKNNTVVKNSASIYFDYNESVVTNEVSNKFVNELPVEIIAGTKDQSLEKSWVYPNPANKVINISSNILSQYTQAELISSLGSTNKKFDLSGGSNGELQIDDIPSGLYLIRLSGRNKKEMMTKILVRKEN